jgi:hypothetical protein
MLLLTADEGAPTGFKVVTMTAQGQHNGQVLERDCALASHIWPVKDSWQEIPAPRLLSDIAVSVGHSEVAPLTITPENRQTYEVPAGGKISIRLRLTRRCEFSGSMATMKLMGAGFEQHPAINLPLDQERSELAIDLAKLKTAPGDYQIALYGGVVAKYVPPNPSAKPAETPKSTDIVDIVVSTPIAIRVLPEPAK